MVWINQFIRDAEILVNKEDTAALHIINKFDDMPHIKFDFTDQELNEIYNYVTTECGGQTKPQETEMRVVSCY